MIEISNYIISMIHWSMLFQITVKSFKVLRWTISNFNTEPQGKYLRWTNLHIVDHGTLFEWMNSHSHHLLHFFLFWSDLVWLCFRRILLFPKGNNNKGADLSIYLEAVKTANMSEGWSRDVKIKFNQLEIVTHGFEEKVYHLTVKVCLLMIDKPENEQTHKYYVLMQKICKLTRFYIMSRCKRYVLIFMIHLCLDQLLMYIIGLWTNLLLFLKQFTQCLVFKLNVIEQFIFPYMLLDWRFIGLNSKCKIIR
jgi:hypothetical protein